MGQNEEPVVKTFCVRQMEFANQFVQCMDQQETELIEDHVTRAEFALVTVLVKFQVWKYTSWSDMF